MKAILSNKRYPEVEMRAWNFGNLDDLKYSRIRLFVEEGYASLEVDLAYSTKCLKEIAGQIYVNNGKSVIVICHTLEIKELLSDLGVKNAMTAQSFCKMDQNRLSDKGFNIICYNLGLVSDSVKFKLKKSLGKIENIGRIVEINSI